MKTRTIVLALLTSTGIIATHAVDLTVVGNLNVASNLAANVMAVNTVTLGGVARTNWPSGGGATVSAMDLTTAVLDFSQPARFYRYTLSADATWTLTNHVAGKQVWLQVAQDPTGGWQNTWPTGLLWSGSQVASVAATPNHFSVFRILDNGSNWLAQAEGLDYSVPCVTNCNDALQFDGNQNYVSATYDATLDPPLATDMTIEAWFKTSSLTDQTIAGTASWWLDGWFLWIQHDGGAVWFVPAGLPDGDPARVIISSTGYADGAWHHAAATWNRTTLLLTLWVDGAAVSTVTGNSANFTAGSAGFRIGTGFAGSFAGSLDEIRISNMIRYTDTFDRCTALNFTSDTNTVAYWKFNEGSGTAATDSTGNGHDGTLQGSPVPTWVSGVTCSSQQQMAMQRGAGNILGRNTRTSLPVVLTNSPLNGSSATITDTLGRVWGLLSHP